MVEEALVRHFRDIPLSAFLPLPLPLCHSLNFCQVGCQDPQCVAALSLVLKGLNAVIAWMREIIFDL
ncbi:hypothetical protein VNO77_12427 [Canavalia gladiata]|uniref:Uncharacterized protein n=1 Tax=Canavalia gladiata TaxID=3824 RepID=A0AAN9LXD2_CANGL